MSKRFNYLFWIGAAFFLASAASIALFLVNVNLAMVVCSTVLVCIACGAFYWSGVLYGHRKLSAFVLLEDLDGDYYDIVFEYRQKEAVVFLLFDTLNKEDGIHVYSISVPATRNVELENFFAKHGFRWTYSFSRGSIRRIKQ